ncbi:hypothetical protein BOTBODRAFT_549180 [Botryobasidium botryosum FD-172 SS1]|uniref:Carboxylic ester hydrolase n=1 Tax=Botryobasidium botryosum (strain FD-172 SS1) TaxID=930990 RepID=A0A067MR63_BOTB1|nr:hypothetical protein BOTBODRAFT_549180 [Botryobasidium botryosum FD-172 SS1]
MRALLNLGIFAYLQVVLADCAHVLTHTSTLYDARDESPIVHGHGVDYIGYKHATLDQDVFKGIPFAQPPVGPLRFKPPVAFSPPSVINATVPSPGCPQATVASEPVSEDCLTLNIWRPHGLGAAASDGRPSPGLPVMLWIYGGGFVNGSTQYFYPGDGIVNTSQALNTPVLFVNFNYRLGVFGFPVGKEAVEKNALNLGLLDQRLAIEWVHSNIAFFGGDPNKITIFGESAGAMSVGLQMFYNRGNIEGAFRGAIMESGSVSSYSAVPADVPARQAAYNFLTNFTGCSTAADTFECLREVDTEKLQEAHRAVYALPPDLSAPDPYPSAFGPTESPTDLFLPSNPRRLLEEGKYAKIPSICGTNLDEGTIFIPNPQTPADVVAFFTAQLPGLTFNINDITAFKSLLALYPDNPAAGSPYGTGNETFGRSAEYKRAASIYGDLIFEAPRRDFLRHAPQAWSYQFTQKPIITADAEERAQYGASHASELDLLFQYLPTDAITPEVYALESRFLHYFIAFAYNLDPNLNSPGGVHWPAYGESQQSLRIQAAGDSIIKDDYRSASIDFIIQHPSIYR